MADDLDLTEAVAVAARQWFENAQAIDGWSDVSWDDLTPDEQEQMTTPARWVLNAAAPLLAAQVRAQIAADIETREAGPGSDHYAHGYSCAIEDAATIARGDS